LSDAQFGNLDILKKLRPTVTIEELNGIYITTLYKNYSFNWNKEVSFRKYKAENSKKD